MSESVRVSEKKSEATKNNRKLQMRESSCSQSINSPVDRVLFLQRTIGNRAVEKLIRSGTLQAKLRIGQPGDAYEQEADRVASEVMRLPEVSTQINPRCPPVKDPSCGGEDKIIRSKTISGQPPVTTPDIESKLNSLEGKGMPLSESVRIFFEPRFGHDFSQVRLHAGSETAQLSRAMNARAFTYGRDIYLGEGKNDLESSAGKQLLAHELAHVVQQGGVPSGGLLSVAPTDEPWPKIRGQPGQAMIQRDIGSDDYNQGYQDGLNGLESNAGPRDGEALVDYNEGYAKGHYEFSQQSSSGGTPGPTPSEKDPTLLSDEELLAEYQSTLAESDPAMKDYLLALEAELLRRQLFFVLSDKKLLAEYQNTLAASDPAMEDYLLALEAELQRRQLIPPVKYTKYTGGGTIETWISAACAAIGAPDNSYWQDGYKTLCQRESGLNSNSVNTSDINATGAPAADGYPVNCSRGIAQVVPRTFTTFHAPGTSWSIYDPVANIAASMNYVRHGYGVLLDGSNLAANVQQADPIRSPKGY